MFSLLLLFGAAVPAAAAELMRVTFVRHGESAGNASGLIDTSTPGPVLTPTGQQQARDVVGTLGDNNYDAIYGSTMVRTQLTGAPMSQYLRLPIQVLPGLQEIEAGIFEGTPEADAEHGYAQAMLAWTFAGQRDVRIPGSINGHEFDARVDGALQAMYDNGDRNPVVFSHGGTIMFWTMMNVQNLTLAEKIELLRSSPLDNTDYVVIEGNPEDGWTLVNWNGQQFSPDLTLAGATRLHIRTLSRQLVGSVQQVVEALATGDFAKIVTAVNRGVADVAYSTVKFQRAMIAKVSSELGNVFAPTSPAPAPVEESTVAADSTSGADVTQAPEVATLMNTEATEAPADTKAAKHTATTDIEALEVSAVDDSSIVMTETDTAADDASDLTGGKAVLTQTQTRPGQLPDTGDDVDDPSTVTAPKFDDDGDTGPGDTQTGADDSQGSEAA
ncbi:histidine phosphatase family protein [Mycolicibacterium sp. XJ1819]